MEREIKCPKCGEVFKVDEVSYASIVKQVRDAEFSHDVEERVHQAVEVANAKSAQELQAKLTEKERLLLEARAEADALKAQLKAEAETAKVREQALIDNRDKEIALAKQQAENETNKQLSGKDTEIAELRIQISQKDSEKRQLKDSYEMRLKDMNDAIERLKDMKLKLSTKGVGESLEQYCSDEFNKIRATAFPNAYFEKDNKVSETGSKGDFIFREESDGAEVVSIMFEMKNENEATKTKHKNEDFLAELDKDRREKGCEYAVLVTLLEAESELYNQGIVDVSHRFPKMYVIRPQFFIPMITLLRNAAEKSIETKKELILARNQNIDITNFESDLNDWKDSWGKNITDAAKRHSDAIEQIDKAIADLEKVKKALQSSDKHLLAAENKMEKLTIKKLTAKNPTMKEKFREAGAEV